MSGPPSLSRRDILRVGGVGAGAALAGCAGGSSASLDTWTPEKDTWPLARYDPANSGHNPHATPPRQPVESAWQVDAGVEVSGLLVSQDLIVAHGEDGIVAIPKEGTEPLWGESTPAQAAGFYTRQDEKNTRLYASGETGHQDGKTQNTLRAWAHPQDKSPTFERRYETHGNGGEPTTLVVGGDSLYVGHAISGKVVAFDYEDGGEKWRVGGSHPALMEGALVTSGIASLQGYRPRSVPDVWLNGGPGETWTADGGDQIPALVDGRVINGERGINTTGPTFHGYNAESGEPLWEPLTFGDLPTSPAVVGDTAYVGVMYYELWEQGGWIPGTGELVAVDLGDGSVSWRRETDWWHLPTTVGGDVVVAHGGVYNTDGDAGRVRAYDAESGDVLWTFTAPGIVDAVAPVGSTVYAGSRDGTVYALRVA